jgi:PKD repeat protein
MRKLLLLTAPLFVVLVYGCQNKTPVGPGVVTITESTTSTTTTTTTTSTIPDPTVATFVFSPLTPEEMQTVRFDASDSKAGTGRTIVDYDWDFGDGTEKKGVSAQHDFSPSGVYLVTLTVMDSAGQKVKNAQTITVRPIIPAP